MIQSDAPAHTTAVRSWRRLEAGTPVPDAHVEGQWGHPESVPGAGPEPALWGHLCRSSRRETALALPLGYSSCTVGARSRGEDGPA